MSLSEPSSAKKEVLLFVSGSIAAYKACHLVSRLVQAGHGVQVVASAAALNFVGAPTWEGLSGRPVVSDLWEPGRAMDHIHLVRRADLVVAAPASANLINRMAAGIGDDLMTTMFLAHDFKKPFMIAPAMNTSMYLHPATQGSLKKLREMGVEILETASGVLACGETGFGKLLDPDLILQEILRALPGGENSSPNARNETKVGAHGGGTKTKRVLVTAGGTRERIDDARVITNVSTGKSGVRLAETLSSLGFDVTLLRAKSAPLPQAEMKTIEFESFADLERGLRETLATGDFHGVIHMAAVSDYVVDRVLVDGREAKLDKVPSGAKLTLEMKPTPKLIAALREWSPNRAMKVAGFKLTSNAAKPARDAAADQVLRFADVVVGNDLSEIDDSKNVHPYVLHSRGGRENLAGFAEMSASLAKWLATEEEK